MKWGKTMEKLSIRRKLVLVFGVLLAIFLAESLYAGYNLYRINSGALRIATEHLEGVLTGMESRHTLAEFRAGSFAVVTAKTLPNRLYTARETKNLASQLDIAFDELAPSIAPEAQDDFATVRDEWASYQKTTAEAVELAKAGDSVAATAKLEDASTGYEEMSDRLGSVVDSSKDAIHAESVAASAQYEKTKWTLIVCLVLVLAIATVMARYLSRGIMQSVDYLTNVSNEVAKGNLTVETEPQSEDELGALTRSYGETISHLRGLIEGIQQTADKVATFARQLTENASQSAQATQQVATSITNVAAASSEQGTMVSDSLKDIQTMADSIEGFAEKAKESAKATSEVTKLADGGRTAVDGAVNQMAEISNTVLDSAKTIEQLAERGAEIGRISDTIAEIAEQTNLLALNAAIEAARAGEAGRGFSVVADEVRKLAEGSSKAAEQIAQLIGAVQQDTAEAAKRMKQGTDEVESGKSVVAEAGKTFKKIADAVAGLDENSRQILEAAKNSSAEAQRVVSVMEKINTSSQSVAQETESVSAATEEQSASMDEVSQASDKLSGLASELTESTQRFKI